MNDELSDAVPVTISGLRGQLQATLQLITSAHQQLRILSQELDRRIWSDPGIVEALRAFAVRSQRAELRILVKQPQRAAQRGHYLVELARRLPSRIAIHELNEEHHGFVEEFTIADEYALLHKRQADDLDAQWYAHAPMDARRMGRRFDALWEASSPARELAVLGI